MERTIELITRPSSVFEKQFELLKLEIQLIDTAIRSQDDITKSIKNWAIVTWTASVGFAVANPSLARFVWATAFVPLAFWIVDGFFRRIQRTFVVRVQEISAFVNGPSFAASVVSGGALEFHVLQMRSMSGPLTSWFDAMRFRTVAVLYLLMIAGSVLVSILLARS